MTPFARTLNRLLEDHGWVTAWSLLGGIGVLSAWVGWAVLARVALYAVSTDARVELDAAAYPVVAPVPGRVVETRLRPGQAVRRGDVLVAIDARPELLESQRERARATGLASQASRLRAQIAGEDSARIHEQESGQLRIQETGHRVGQARIAAGDAEAQLTRLRVLHAKGLATTRDLEKAEAEAGMLHAEVDALEATLLRLAPEQALRDRERSVRQAALERELVAVLTEQTSLAAEADRLGYEIERRLVRAPVDGRLAETTNLQVGAVLSSGERLGSILPEGRLVVVARYSAESALGRLRSGQQGTVRLTGFPWVEFGALRVTVANVAQEVRDGLVRVDLAIDSTSGFHGRLGHGMPGTVEVVVERLSPVSLVLRTAGQWLTRNP